MLRLYYSQELPINLQEAWDFFSSPLNLEKITPKKLALKIKHHDRVEKIYPGQIIVYTVKPFWSISMEWVTEIVAVEDKRYFIDEQRFGPYAFWHHEHRFSSIPEGVLIEDLIYYKLPLGFLGEALNTLKVRKDLQRIFAYRSEILTTMFGSTKK